MIKQKKKAITDVLTSAKNNPKFAKLLSYSFTSLDKMITPPNSDARLNAQLVIESGGIEVLRSIALKNPHNEEIMKQIANIIVKLTSINGNVDQELSQKFVEAKGHEAVIEMLLSKDKDSASVPLIKCLNNLCQVPQLINKLLDAGLAETIKLVNDMYSDDMGVVRMNLDTMKKVSNQKAGREFLIKKGIVPSILKTVKNCCDRMDNNAVYNGLIVVDNICRNEEGRQEVKEADAPLILCDVVENFSESARIMNKAAKILGKIMTKPDLEKLLGKIKNCSDKLDRSDDQETINEIKDNVALVSNLMLVDELGKTVCLPNNFDMLSQVFKKLSNIDLENKKPGYVKDYMQAKKHFLTLIKRECDIKPEILDDYEDEDIQTGEAFTNLMDTADDCIKKNWNNTVRNVEQLEQSGDKDGDLIPLKNAWKGLFTSYSDIIKLKNDRKNEEQKKKPKWIELLNYLVGDIISKGKTYFGEDEKPNYSASNVLKIADDVVNNYPDECLNLPDNIKKCFPYIKGVIGFSDNWRTLKNNLDVIYNTVKKESDDSPIKKDIIPVVTKFMDDKYKYRNPNLVNLNILDDYLKPEFASQMLKKPDVKANPNFGLNYVNAIDSAMVKPFYTSSTVLKEVGGEDDLDKDEGDDQKEPRNEEVEKKIIGKGADLLKRLIPLEEYSKQVKEFKKNANSFSPDTSKVDDVLKLEDNLIYQNCALNVDEFFNAGMNEDLGTLKDLIKKEMNFIESFKRLKSNENNPKYNDICDASNKRLKLQLGTLRKLEDQGIDKFGKTKDEKYKNLLKDIINVNADILNKSSDTKNLMDHLDQLKNNVGFLRDNEKELSDDKNKSPSETYINSLMKLLNKAINDEELSDSIIKTLIAFANKKPNICNLLVKAGCPRMLLQIMDKTQNRQLANDAMELLKLITLSAKENAEVIGNQNILLKLFEIRSKFASSDSITKNADAIANELLKMPGQGKFAEGFIKDAIKEFHDNVQKDFNNNEVKQKILNNEEVINSFTSNPKAIEPILERQFIKDLNRACDLTAKDPEVSMTIDKLLTNEMGILKKIKDNIPSKDDDRHSDVAANVLKILLDKSNFEEPLLLSCKCLSDYVKDDQLYNKHLNNKIDGSFVDTLFEIQDNYLDNPEIIKEINNILCYLSLRNPKLAEAIIKKGGLANVIDELKAVANLNDPASKLLKLNGLKMLNSLLNNNKNLDAFLNAGGVDLINKIVKNEVDSTPKNEEDEDASPEDKYLTKGTIFTKTPEQLEEEEILGINSYTALGLNKDEADKKRAQLLNDLNDSKSKDSTSSGGEDSDDSDNYFVQCLKIINKGLDNGKNDFVDDKTVQNLTNLAAVNFPDKFLFNEIATILANKDVKLNPDAIEDLKNLLKLTLSNKAQFYGDGNVSQKVKAINDKIANMLMNDFRYKSGLKNAIRNKGFNDGPIPGKLSDDRFGEMPSRAPDDSRPIPGKLKDDRFGDMGPRAEDDSRHPGKLNDDRFGDMGPRAEDDSRHPGKLNDDRFGDMGRRDEDGGRHPGKLKNPFDGQGKQGKDGRPIPGKLKNKFGNKPKEGFNKSGGKPRGKKEEKPTLDNKKKGRKDKGIELFDKDGNKYEGTYKPAEPEGEKYELYDKLGNRLDGRYKKVPGRVDVIDKNGKKLDDGYKQVVADCPDNNLIDKNGNKIPEKMQKMLSKLDGVEIYDKNGNLLDGKYANLLSTLPAEVVYDKYGNKLEGIYRQDEPENTNIELFDRSGRKLDGTYRKLVSNAPHDELYDKNGALLDNKNLYKKVLSSAPSNIIFNKRGSPLSGKYINLVSGIPNEQVFDKNKRKLDGIFKKMDENSPYVEAYDRNGKKLGIYNKVDPDAKGEEVYDKNKNKFDGKYRKVIPDIREGEAYDRNGNRLKGFFKKDDPKVLNPGEKIYDKNGNLYDGTYRNLENEAQGGEELFDKNGNKLDGTYRNIIGDSPKEELYDQYGNNLGTGFKVLDSGLPIEDVYDKNGNKLSGSYAPILVSLPSEDVYDKNGNKIDGVYAKEDTQPSFVVYNKRGKKLEGKYVKCLQDGIVGYDKNGQKLDGFYRKAGDDDEYEELFDESGNKLDGTYKEEEPRFGGEDLFDKNGNKLDGTYQKVVIDEPHEDVFDKNGNKLEDAYKKLGSDVTGTDAYDKNGELLDGKYIDLRSAFPLENIFDSNKNKLTGVFAKVEGDIPYFAGFDRNGNRLDGVYVKLPDNTPGLELYDQNGKKLDGAYNQVNSDLPDGEVYDKSGNKLWGTYKKVDDSKPGEEVFDKWGNNLGKYRNIENDVPGIELFDEDGYKLDGTFKRIVSDQAPPELYDIYGNKLDGTYRKLESDLPGIDAYDKNRNKLGCKYVNVISSIPTEELFDSQGNKVKAIYKKVEEDTPVEEAYDRLGKKLDGTYKKVDYNEPGYEIYDKNGNKLSGAFKKLEFTPVEELYDKNGNKLNGEYKKVVAEIPRQDIIFNKRGKKLKDYVNVISEIPEEDLYDKNGNLIDGKYINVVSNIPYQPLFDKNGNNANGIFRKIEDDTPYTEGYDINGNKLKGVYKKNEPNSPGDEIYDKNGNKLSGTYNKVESGVPDEDVFDRFGNFLDGTFVKVDPDSGLPGIDLFDKNGIKFDGIYRNVELDSPGEELFDSYGKRLDGTYKKVISDKYLDEAYDKNGNKLSGNYRKLESDIPGIDAYDKNNNKLPGKFVNLVSSFPDYDILDRNGQKIKGIYRRVNPNNPNERGNEIERPLPGKLRDRFGDKGKGGDKNKPTPGKLKDRFGDKGKGDPGNRPLPGKLKDRFGPNDKGPKKNNGGGRKLGKPNVFDKGGKKKERNYKKTDSKVPSIELYDKNKKRMAGTYRKLVSEKPVPDAYDKNGKKLDGIYHKLESDLPGTEGYDNIGNKITDPLIKVVSCMPQTTLFDHNKNKLNGIFRKDDSAVPDTEVFDKNGKKLDGKYKKLETEFPETEAFDKNGNKLKEAYVKLNSDTPILEAYDRNGNKLDGLFREIEPDKEGEAIFDRIGNYLGCNYINLQPSQEGNELFDKNNNLLSGTYAKIPSAISGEEVYDKTGNKCDGIYRKNLDPDALGEELFDKNGNKLDGTYKKIIVDTPPLEVFDRKGNKLAGLYRKCEPDVYGEEVFDRNRNQLAGKYLKVDSDRPGIEAFDRNRNKLEGTYKKEESGVEPIIGYNQNGNKLDGVFALTNGEPSVPVLFDKNGNKLNGKFRRVDLDTPLTDVYDKYGKKLDGTFKKDPSDEPETAVFDKYGNEQFFKTFKRDKKREPSEILYDRNGTLLDGTYKKIISDRPTEEVFDKNGNKLSGTFRKIDDTINPIELYDRNGKKLDGKYINPLSCIPSEELYDKNKNRVNGIYRKIDTNIPGVDAYDPNGKKLRGIYKKVEDDAPGEEVFDRNGIKLDGKYRNIENELDGEDLFAKNGQKLDGKYKKVVGDPAQGEVFDKQGNKLAGTYRKVLSDLPTEELFDKNGQRLDDDYINVVSSLPQEEFYDKNGYRIDGIYKKDDQKSEEEAEELYDEDGYKFDGTFKKVIQDDPTAEIYDKNRNRLDNHYKKVFSGVPGIDAFDKNGNKLDGKYTNIITDIPNEELLDQNGNRIQGLFRKVDSEIPLEEAYDENGNKLAGVYKKADSGGIDIFNRNGKKLEGKYNKVKSDVPEDEAYDQYGNKLDGTYKKLDREEEDGEMIYDKNGNKLDGLYRKLENDCPSLPLYNKNGQKLAGTYKQVLAGEPVAEIYDKNGNKIDGTYRKVESDLPGCHVYDRNGNRLDDKYAPIISNLPPEQIFDKNKNKKNAVYRKVDPDIEVEEAYDKLGNLLYGSYRRANDDEPGFELFDKYGNKLDGTYKKMDSDGPSVEIYDKNNNKFDGTYKKLIDDQPGQVVFNRRGQKLPNYNKILSDVPGEVLYDKNGNRLDGKYVDVTTNLPYQEVFDKNGNKLLGIFRQVDPESEGEELYNSRGSKLDGTYRKCEDGEPGIEAYNKNGIRLQGRYKKNDDSSPQIELFDRNKNKLNGTYRKVIGDAPREDVYDRFGNKLNGKYRKLQSDLPGVDAFDQNGNKLEGKYGNLISSLPPDEVFDKNGQKLKGVFRKNNPVPGKLNDDRFADPGRIDDDNTPLPGRLNDDNWDMGKRAPDDNRPLPGKLKNPFDGQGKPDDRNRKTPGKLKPFNEPKPADDRNRNVKGRKPGEKGGDNGKPVKSRKPGKKQGEEDNQEQNKLLTYLSLVNEQDSFKNVFADATPEICSFFNHLHSAYKPVIDKILKDKEDKIKELQNKNLLAKSEKGDSPIIVEPFNINSLPDKEKYDEGVVLSLAKLYNYILEQAAKSDSAYRPGKLKNPFDGQGKPGDKKGRIPGKLKNPFDGQGKPGDKNRPIPGKLKKQGEEEPESSGPRKYGKPGERNEDDEIYKNLLSGKLHPDDPVNNEFVTNLQIMADPIYNPENYIFVKQFNNEMNRVMDNLGKYDEEPSPDEEKIEVTENYLAHLGALFSKAVPFLDDLHKEINKNPNGRFPDLKKDKEENLDTILNATEQYYKCDEDNDIKAEASKDMCDVCLNLLDDLSKDDIVDKGKEDKLRNINKLTNKLWNLVNHAVKNDEKNLLVDPNNANRLRELINKLDTAINVKGINDKKLREIPNTLSEKIDAGDEKVGQELLDFIFNDLAKHGNDPEVRELDEKTLSNLSKCNGLMKQIMKNDAIWRRLKEEYQDPNLTYEKRLMLAKLFNNATKNNYNIENMIDNDPQGIKALLAKLINDPVKTLDNGGNEIAETEVDTLCNLLKERNNYRELSKNNLITEDQVQKLDSLYRNLDPKIGEPLRPILAQIREADKAKKEKDNVAEDEKKLFTIEKRVGNCFETHKRALLKYAAAFNPANERQMPGKLNDDRWDMGKRAPDDNRPLPGKLKNPFDGQGKPEERDRPIPGKLKNPFDGQGKPEERDRPIPGKLKNPFGDQPEGNDFLKKASSLRKMSFVSGTLLLHQADNAKIKSSLSSSENPEMSDDINKIISLLRKNYNDMKNTEEPDLNIKRAENVHKCLNLLKKLSLAPANHKPILEGGFMNFMEKLDDDYKLIKDNGEPDLNNMNLGFEVNGKNVLQACSNSDNAIPIIAESPVFESTIKEVNNLYEKPELIAANSDVEKLFSYDNVIFSNLCKDKEAFSNIFNKMGLDKLMRLGKKTGNANLLDAILNMLKNYTKNSPDINRVPPEIIDSTFEIMNKSAGLSDRTAPLMCKVLDLGNLLYTDNLKPRVDALQLIKIMNDDIDTFKGNHAYLNSCLNLLSKLTKDNPMNAKQALDSGLLRKLNLQVSNIVQEGPEKYEANKDKDEEDENGYLKTCYNLSKLYNNLVQNDMDNVEKFNQMGITEKTVNMLDVFNDKVEPKTEEEKAADLYRKKELSSSAYRKGDEEDVDKMKPSQLVRGIMTNCGGALEQITVPPASNDYLSTRTTFNDTINKTLENENNDTDYLISALRALSNHVFNDNGKNYSKLDLPRDYKICRELQSKFYSNPEILSNINSLAGAMVRNLKDDNKGKEYAKKFYDLIPETIKVQDYNPDLVLMSLKLMNDGLHKKPYLVDQVYDETVPTVLNILKLYKDNPEIQETGYKILSEFARNNIFSSAMINNGLLDVMKDTLENALFSDEMKDNVIGLKSEIFKLVNSLAQEKENCPKIADELMGNLISNVIEKGYTDEGKIIVPLLQSLLLNNNCIPPFVQYNGIDACIKLLNDNDSNVPLISNIFGIFKSVSNSNDEYKKMLQDKKVPDLINRIIKKMGPYDKKIEFEGRQLLFNVNLYKVQLEDPNSIGVDEIKIIEPIPPEVRNYLTSGKQIKIVNNNGDIKPMQLIFTPDLMRVSAKKIKSNLPPKPKYIIDTPTIKKVLKGHGTDSFKKSKGLFRKIPPPELCFSIIGPTTVEGMKSLNVLCETEKEVDKWIKYLEIVLNYFKKTKAIKGAVIVKKK